MTLWTFRFQIQEMSRICHCKQKNTKGVCYMNIIMLIIAGVVGVGCVGVLVYAWMKGKKK